MAQIDVARPTPASTGRLVRRLAPVAALALGVAGFFALGLGDYLTFDALRDNREVLTGFVAQNAVLAVAAFVALYAISTALSLPGGLVLTVAGGFLFGTVGGTAIVAVGATVGAVAIFLAARTALGDALRAKAGSALQRMEAGFQETAFSYLLVLRLVPLFPFFLVNIVPAFMGMALRPYVLATFVGILPGTFVYASVGAGLGSVFDGMDDFSPAAALTPEVITALVGLSVLSLLPVAYKQVKKRRA